MFYTKYTNKQITTTTSTNKQTNIKYIYKILKFIEENIVIHQTLRLNLNLTVSFNVKHFFLCCCCLLMFSYRYSFVFAHNANWHFCLIRFSYNFLWFFFTFVVDFFVCLNKKTTNSPPAFFICTRCIRNIITSGFLPKLFFLLRSEKANK